MGHLKVHLPQCSKGGGNKDKVDFELLNDRAKARAPEAAPWRWWVSGGGMVSSKQGDWE